MIRLAESQYLSQMGLRDIYRFCRTIWHWSALTEQPQYFPEFLWIETTNACNLRCKMCPQSMGDGRPTGQMSAELYEALLEQAKGRVYGIFLFFGGDPLCDPAYADRIRAARERNLRVFVHTNATLLNAENTKNILDAEPTTISFSLDTADGGRYESWRIGARFEKTIANIRQFIRESRKRKRRPLTIIQLIDIEGSGNRDEAALRNLLGEDQPDTYQIRSLHDWAGEMATEEIKNVSSDQAPYYPCALLWKAMVICWDGQVAACCNDLEGKLILGDAKTEKLFDIWRGDKMVALRQSLIDGNQIPKLCEGCVNLNHPLGKNPAVKLARSLLGGYRRLGKK